MLVSQKSQYALRAIFELSKHYGNGPVKIAGIAEAQAIPPRFLEVILSQLKQGGIVDSRRGIEGGYFLLRHPRELNVGHVLQFMQGSFSPVACVAEGPKKRCPLNGDCVFLPMWEEVRDAVNDIYDTTSFQKLLDSEMQRNENYSFNYTI